MNSPDENLARRDRKIAGLLWYGTWIASAVITVGMIMGFVPGLNGYAVVKAGVALFILLPIARVVLTIFLFLRERDYTYAAIAAGVLAIIAVGIMIGIGE